MEQCFGKDPRRRCRTASEGGGELILLVLVLLLFEFRTSSFVLRVSYFEFRTSSFVLRVSYFEFRTSSFGFRVSDFVHKFVLYIRRVPLRHKDYGNALSRSRWRAIGPTRGRNPAREPRRFAPESPRQGLRCAPPPRSRSAAIRKCPCKKGFGRSNSVFRVAHNDN